MVPDARLGGAVFELILGPTCSGKTTLIAALGLSPVTFAYALADGALPDRGALHFALPMPPRPSRFWRRQQDPTVFWPKLGAVIGSGQVTRATVTLCPEQELADRIGRRMVIGDGALADRRYDSAKNLRKLARCDLALVYHDVFRALRRHRIETRLLLTSAETPGYPKLPQAMVPSVLAGVRPSQFGVAA